MLSVISDIPITPNCFNPRPPAWAQSPFSLFLTPLHASPHNEVDAGLVPPRSRWFDFVLRAGTLFDVVDWQTGKKQAGGIGVVTRPSMLYSTLFATLGDKFLIFRDILFAIAVFFGLIEVVAFFIGIRLSRSMTASVGELYRATVHVNRGDLSHRIQLRGRDQMAALDNRSTP